jgi:hypothetical protein
VFPQQRQAAVDIVRRGVGLHLIVHPELNVRRLETIQHKVKETCGTYTRICHDENALDAQSRRLGAHLVRGAAPNRYRGRLERVHL